VFSVSEQYARFMISYLAIPAAKVHVVPLGVNIESLKGAASAEPKSGRRVGFFGRIAPEKGLHVLCDAYRRLRERRDLGPLTLEAAGYLAPEYRTYLADVEAKMRGWGLESEFRYHGELDRAAKGTFLRSLDVFSLPATYDEPKGLSVLEAMACGVPVVASRLDAGREALANGALGILVDPTDAASVRDGILAALGRPRGVPKGLDRFSDRAFERRVHRLLGRLFADDGPIGPLDDVVAEH
jgi:glycosyltransferase involved in cell wall biosynthesis